MLTRRTLIIGGAGLAATAGTLAWPRGDAALAETAWAEITDKEWRERLTPEQYRVLRREGTERAFTSPLNAEKRPGTYHCAGCDLPLFDASWKYESGTGWPSFWKHFPDAFGFKQDFVLFYPRTEYHCARCGGHHGHVFNDGPQPTGKRFCNNGVALTFKPAADAAPS